MTLIKCSHCGHTVLSVASHCPACARPLGQTFLPLDHEGALAQCRSCGHQVRTRTRVCPNCGAQDPARWPRAVRSALAAGMGVAALAVLAIIARSQGLADRPPPLTAPETTAAVALRPGPQPETTATRPNAPAAMAGTSAAAPVQHLTPNQVQHAAADPGQHVAPDPGQHVAPDPGQRAAADPAPRVASDPVQHPADPRTDSLSTPPAPLPRSGLETRWTSTWVNVRSAPSNEAPVLRVLDPGTAVRCAAARWGWWTIRLGGDSVGYIAGALLSTHAPGTN